VASKKSAARRRLLEPEGALVAWLRSVGGVMGGMDVSARLG